MGNLDNGIESGERQVDYVLENNGVQEEAPHVNESRKRNGKRRDALETLIS